MIFSLFFSSILLYYCGYSYFFYMSSHRRVVRTNSSDSNPIILVPNLGSYIWRLFVHILCIVWKCIRVLWYWLERIFLVTLLISLTV